MGARRTGNTLHLALLSGRLLSSHRTRQRVCVQFRPAARLLLNLVSSIQNRDVCFLQGPQLPDTSEATPVEALQNTQAEGNLLLNYWTASSMAGDAAGLVLFEALQAEQGRAWRAAADRHLRREHGPAVSSNAGADVGVVEGSCCLLLAACFCGLCTIVKMRHEARGSYLA